MAMNIGYRGYGIVQKKDYVPPPKGITAEFTGVIYLSFNECKKFVVLSGQTFDVVIVQVLINMPKEKAKRVCSYTYEYPNPESATRKVYDHAYEYPYPMPVIRKVWQLGDRL